MNTPVVSPQQLRQAAALIEQLLLTGPGTLTTPEREFALELAKALAKAGGSEGESPLV